MDEGFHTLVAYPENGIPKQRRQYASSKCNES
jgi:hypothetical protein